MLFVKEKNFFIFSALRALPRCINGLIATKRIKNIGTQEYKNIWSRIFLFLRADRGYYKERMAGIGLIMQKAGGIMGAVFVEGKTLGTEERKMKRTFVFSVIMFLCISSFAFSETRYTVIDLGTLGGNYAAATSINEYGQITGFSKNASGIERAFIYSNGVMTDLGTLGNYVSAGFGINDSGQIAGMYYTSPGRMTDDARGFVYNNGTITTLSTLGGSYGLCEDINNSGQATGMSSASTGYEYPVRYNSNGSVTNLGGFGTGGEGCGLAINNKGEITGSASGLQTDYHVRAFLYRNGYKRVLPTLGGYNSFGYDINENGIVVGASDYSTGSSLYHAFVYNYKNGVMTDLGTLGGNHSCAEGINDLGQITGWSLTTPNSSHAFLYENGVMLDLNTLIDPASGWLLSSGTGMNDLGQICGTGFLQGKERAFLLTPIPEPCTVLLLGLGGLLIRKR